MFLRQNRPQFRPRRHFGGIRRTKSTQRQRKTLRAPRIHAMTGAEKLAGRQGPWGAVWKRFCEAPQRYPNIPDTLRKCQMPSFDLLSDISTKGAWPQWNDSEEDALRQNQTVRLIWMVFDSPTNAFFRPRYHLLCLELLLLHFFLSLKGFC